MSIANGDIAIPQRSVPLEHGQSRHVVIARDEFIDGWCLRVQGKFDTDSVEQRRKLHRSLSDLLVDLQERHNVQLGEGRSYVYPCTETTSLLVLRAPAF